MIPSFCDIEDLFEHSDYERLNFLDTVVVTTCFLISITTVFI
jgi:hypothetical protein